MKGLLFVMMIVGSFSVFASENKVYSAGADCGERVAEGLEINTNSGNSGSGSGSNIDG